MPSPEPSLILCVDDSPDSLHLIELWLKKAGHQVVKAESGLKGLQILGESKKPDLILLDVNMPGMDGYAFCERLQKSQDLAWIPVIFLTGMPAEQNLARAFALGGVDYLMKPVKEAGLLQIVKRHLKTKAHWDTAWHKKPKPTDFFLFKEFLVQWLNLSGEAHYKLLNASCERLYIVATELGILSSQVAQCMSQFLRMPYLPKISVYDIPLGFFPPAFCKANSVVLMKDAPGHAVVISNPFKIELMDDLKQMSSRVTRITKYMITEPENISALFVSEEDAAPPSASVQMQASDAEIITASMQEIQVELSKLFVADNAKPESFVKAAKEASPIILFVNKLISDACMVQASDIHIEPMENEVLIRYRIDGELRIISRFSPQRLIHPIAARVKVMSLLDLAERRIPQDGRMTFQEGIDLRVSISPMQFGEKVVMRILQKQKSVLSLDKLGFSSRNLMLYREKLQTPYGLILHVGPTGSGKSRRIRVLCGSPGRAVAPRNGRRWRS